MSKFNMRRKWVSSGAKDQKIKQLQQEAFALKNTLMLLLRYRVPDHTLQLSTVERLTNTQGMTLQVALDPETGVYTLKLIFIEDTVS